MKTAEIVKTTRFKKSTVYEAVKRFQELGGTSDRSRCGRPTTATTRNNVNKVRCRIRRNPERSMQKMAKEIEISKDSVRRIVQNKLKMRSYKIDRAHFLNDDMERKNNWKKRVEYFG
ncbi:PREDICTED: putative uncharacterized protein FLJ37770 [Dufourea novaeangliae]|uniref:putative uncharacterized protein FLJ37770 n=1 Tax=Dufourea novaeangliae TaxID=178035 RepID=UPI000766F1BB|nr:PREDICTED: putative uncharacterized protein FLJ37770 [Dufourea novaeangliae]